jgi:hydroxyacylglutathione hydrolase
MLAVSPIPVFSDNYVWMIQKPAAKEVWLVDPGDAGPVIDALDKGGWNLAGILITHSHADHIGGVRQLLNYRQVPVLGPDSPAIPCVSQVLTDGDRYELFGGELRAIAAPGHLPEHLCYLLEHEGTSQLFSGDTLFSSGCGRVFKGSTVELKTSLDRLKQLPPDTHIYCAHEYTLANIAFAKAVEPDNAALREREREVRALREQGLPSLPSRLSLELEVNPFLRCHTASVRAAIGRQLGHEPAGDDEVFTSLRGWKDGF